MTVEDNRSSPQAYIMEYAAVPESVNHSQEAVVGFSNLEINSPFARQANTCGCFRTDQSQASFSFQQSCCNPRPKPCPTCRIAGQDNIIPASCWKGQEGLYATLVTSALNGRKCSRQQAVTGPQSSAGGFEAGVVLSLI
jgi:hypothetical protein